MRALDDEELLERARGSVSNYCSSTCKSLCCRNGRLNCRDEEQLALVAGDRREKLERDDLIKQEWDGTFSIILTKPCPALDENHKCSVYPARPECCRNFPLFRYGRSVVVAPTCPAQELLAPFLKELRRRDFRVME